MKSLHSSLKKSIRRANAAFGLIEDGDKILVGLSGGKDSLCLLEMLAKMSRIAVPRFTVEAIHVRMANVQYETDTEYIETFARDLGVRLHIVTTSFDETTAGKKPMCFLCSWYRRKEMFNLAQAEGCNKIALGHHQDDIIHTAMLNLFNQGHFSTMPAKMKMRKMPITIIRPLCMVKERDIAEYAALQGYKKQVKLCKYEHASQRTDMRELFEAMEQKTPEVRYSVWHALESEGKLVEMKSEET